MIKRIMLLKSLELIGFKSFVDRTVIAFNDGITAVVGPNGSGKTNVVDAIRWVMGEQSAKHLRGDEMSDVIFNGSEARPATGMASVFLTFDNSDGHAPAEYAGYSEITIGRRLYRSGESEYYINKVPCRLKDIIEFFLGTGVGTKAYSIVEQGQIERIVSAKPEERRQLLEEAAGISKFKMHRDAALRKIEATRQNLARLADIIAELEHQKNSLSRQAKKAERFKVFADELKNLELSLASHQHRMWSEELSALRKRLTEISEEEALKDASVSSEETLIDTIRLELTEAEKKLNKVQERLYELQNGMKMSEAEVRFKTDNMASLGSRRSELTREIIELKAKKEAMENEMTCTNGAKVAADIELASFEEDVTAVQEKVMKLQSAFDETNGRLETLREEIVSCIKEVSEARARAEQIERQKTDIAGRIAKNQTEIDSVDKKTAEIESSIRGAEGKLSEMKGTGSSLAVELSSLVSETEGIRAELQHNEAGLAEMNRMFSVKKSRLISLEELDANFEGYNDGVRAVLRKKAEASSEFSGVFGTISEVIETEPHYETAVGAVLGEKLQYVVVKSQQEGVAAIDYLKTQSAGRSTFVPLEIRESAEAGPSPAGEGVVGPLLNYVRFSEDYRKIGNYLLKDVILVEDIHKALGIWQANGHRKTMVTMDGEVVDPSGAVSGGSGRDVSGRLLAKKREIADLKVEVDRLGGEVAAKEELLSGLRDRIQVNEARIDKLKADIHTHDVEYVHKERDALDLSQQLENRRRERDRLAVDTAELGVGRDSLCKEGEELAGRIRSLEERQAGFESDVERLAAEADLLRKELGAVSEELTAKRVQLASMQEQSSNLARELSRLGESVFDIESEISAKTAAVIDAGFEMEQDGRALEAAKGDIGRLVNEIDMLAKRQSESKLEYDRSLESLRGRELALRELRKACEEVRNSVYELKLEETKSSERLFYLEREIQEKYHIDLAARREEEGLKPFEEGDTIDATVLKASARISELKERLEKIGSVNADAIAEYEGVMKRYEFLTKQSDDLNASLETLHKAIIRINRTSRERFIETFNAVNERFKALFPRLFHGGGRADLVLLDQENVLESGIDIIAQPPGKKLQSVNLLSGGEKALVATTFIFSIFLIKPSPFCLLDEVDAPLDDANIDRFNQLVREMSRLSQFILITHNRRTMELADTLYGVTMEEAGISKIVSVRLEQAGELRKAA